MSGLSGRKIIVTAGPTIEPIDPVRFISNRSSGKQGYLIADALASRGADVRLISGPTCLACPMEVSRVDVETAQDMLAAVEAELSADVFIAVAAVSDWRPARRADQKAEKSAIGQSIQLVENPDILKQVSHHPLRPDLVVGFAAETHDVLERARAKRFRKGCDWIIANDVSGDVMGGDNNAAYLIRDGEEQHWPRAAKSELAKRLADTIDAWFQHRQAG